MARTLATSAAPRSEPAGNGARQRFTLAAGIGEGFTHVAETGIVQRRAPDAVRARVVGASDAAVLIAFAASFTFGGLLVEAIGARGAYAIGGLSCLAASAVLTLAVRRLVREQ